MADLALLIGPGDVITLVRRSRRRQDRRGARHDPLSRRRRRRSRCRARPSRWCRPTICRRFRCFMPISIASTIPSELEEIGLSPLPEGTLALIEWPERAPSAHCRRPDRHRAEPSAGAGIDRARRRNHRLRQGRRAGRTAEGAAAVPRRCRLCRCQTRSAWPAMPRPAPMRGCIRDDGVVILMNFAAAPRRPGDL